MTQPDQHSTPSNDGPLEPPLSPIDSQMSAPPVAPPIVEATLVQQSVSAAESTSEPGQLLQHRGVVLATLFLVTGFLGIPLLWVNRRFSNAEKIFWSIVVTIYTSVLIWIAYEIVMWSYRRIFP